MGTSHYIGEPSESVVAPRAKIPRQHKTLAEHWDPGPAQRIEILTDSLVATQFINGEWWLKAREYRTVLRDLWDTWDSAQSNSLVLPRQLFAPWVQHIYREQTVDADALAGDAHDLGTTTNTLRMPHQWSDRLRFFCDGSKRAAEGTGGYMIQDADTQDIYETGTVRFSKPCLSSTWAELHTLLYVFRRLASLLESQDLSGARIPCTSTSAPDSHTPL